MDELNYLVYECGELVAGFPLMCPAMTFMEMWRSNSTIPMDLVDGRTGEVLDTWTNGEWENGD